jgi:glycosyltransferase involved in cell wall biosynthesis
VYRLLRIGRTIAWHASTELEVDDIRRVFGVDARCHVAVDVRTDLVPARRRACNTGRESGPVRAVFLSRIAPMKNLDGLLRALSLVTAHIELTIAGPIDDAAHWRACEDLIEALPSNTSVRVHGEVAPAQVVEFMTEFDLLILPTHGENYGHVVHEALAAGLPVIVGSNTPWAHVEDQDAGWLVDSSSPTKLADLIERFAALTPRERATMSDSAARLANSIHKEGGGVDAHRRMFREAIEQ